MLSITINEWQTIIKDYTMVTIDALFKMRFFQGYTHLAMMNSVYNQNFLTILKTTMKHTFKSVGISNEDVVDNY